MPLTQEHIAELVQQHRTLWAALVAATRHSSTPPPEASLYSDRLAQALCNYAAKLEECADQLMDISDTNTAHQLLPPHLLDGLQAPVLKTFPLAQQLGLSCVTITGVARCLSALWRIALCPAYQPAPKGFQQPEREQMIVLCATLLKRVQVQLADMSTRAITEAALLAVIGLLHTLLLGVPPPTQHDPETQPAWIRGRYEEDNAVAQNGSACKPWLAVNDGSVLQNALSGTVYTLVLLAAPDEEQSDPLLSLPVRLTAFDALYAMCALVDYDSLETIEGKLYLCTITAGLITRMALYLNKTRDREQGRVLQRVMALARHWMIRVFADSNFGLVPLQETVGSDRLEKLLVAGKEDSVEQLDVQAFSCFLENPELSTLVGRLVRSGLSLLCARFHADPHVRLAFLDFACECLMGCSHTLSKIQTAWIETVLGYVDDDNEMVREACTRRIAVLARQAHFARSLRETMLNRLHTRLKELPRMLTRVASDKDERQLQKLLRVLNGYLSVLGRDTARSAITAFLQAQSLALLRGMQLNVQSIGYQTRIQLEHSPVNAADQSLIPAGMDNTATEDTPWQFAHLTATDTTSQLARFLQRMGACGDTEQLLDHALSLLHASDLAIYRPQCVLLLVDLLTGAAQTDGQKMMPLAAALLDELLEANTLQPPNDADQAMLAMVSLHAVRQCVRCIDAPTLRPLLSRLLYPVCELLSSTHIGLHSQAAKTLATLATVANYPHPRDLLLGNVDYLLNAVSLRLRHLHAHPHTPMMLAALVRVVGAAVLPYADDVLDDLLDSLEQCYAQDAQLRSAIASTLCVLVQAVAESEAATTTTTTACLPDTPSLSIHMIATTATTASTAITHYVQRMQRRAHPTASSVGHIGEDASDVEDDGLAAELEAAEEQQPLPSPSTEEAAEDEAPLPPLPVRYIERILAAAQHHLTLATVTDRTRLLQAIAMAVPVLREHAKQRDPLLHQLWPGLVHTLRTANACTEQVATAQAIAACCADTGNFLLTRFTKQVWPLLQLWLNPADRTGRDACDRAMAALRTCLAIAAHADSTLAWDMLLHSRAWLGQPNAAASLVEQLYRTVHIQHSDLVWLALYTACQPASIAVPSHLRPSDSLRTSAAFSTGIDRLLSELC